MAEGCDIIAGLVDDRFQHICREPGLDGRECWVSCGVVGDPVRLTVGNQIRSHPKYSVTVLRIPSMASCRWTPKASKDAGAVY